MHPRRAQVPIPNDSRNGGISPGLEASWGRSGLAPGQAGGVREPEGSTANGWPGNGCGRPSTSSVANTGRDIASGEALSSRLR